MCDMRYFNLIFDILYAIESEFEVHPHTNFHQRYRARPHEPPGDVDPAAPFSARVRSYFTP